MIYIDSYVFLDLFSGERRLIKKAERYLRLAVRKGLVISTVVITEVAYHLLRRGKEDALNAFLLFLERVEKSRIVSVDKEIALLAAKLRKKYYRKGKCELSYLDCIHAATAIVSKCEKLVTGDKDFASIKEIEVEVY